MKPTEMIFGFSTEELRLELCTLSKEKASLMMSQINDKFRDVREMMLEQKRIDKQW